MKIYYSSDVSIEDHANLVVFENSEGEKEAIHIERDEDSEKIYVYYVELFNKPADSWINEEDLKSINNSCDKNYVFDQELTRWDQYFFTSDLIWYYGADNFGSPNIYTSQDSFEEWLTSRGIIEAN